MEKKKETTQTTVVRNKKKGKGSKAAIITLSALSVRVFQQFSVFSFMLYNITGLFC